MRKTFAALAVAFLFLLLQAPAANAHAQLQSTAPASGSTFKVAPDRVVIRFNEQVSSTTSAIRVFDEQGRRIDSANTSVDNFDPHSLVSALPKLEDGGYVVTWRIASSDAHPVQGAFTFNVGNAETDTSTLAEQLLADTRGNAKVGILLAIARSLLFASIAVIVGGIGFLHFVEARLFHSRTPRRVLQIAVWTALVSTLALFLLQGIYQAGLPFSQVFNTDIAANTYETRFGRLAIAREILLVLVLFTLGRGRLKTRLLAHALLVAGILTTISMSGHADTGRWVPLATLVDVIHLLFASTWIGGLVFLILTMKAQPEIATKFSRLARVSVITVVIIGLFQGLRQVGSVDALTSTNYGALLLTKVAVVVVIISVGIYFASKIKAEASARRFVAIESLLSAAVIVVTALLVSASPAITETSGPFTKTLSVGDNSVEVVITPASKGRNGIHLYALTRTGQPVDVRDITATLSLSSMDVQNVPIPLKKLSPGHYNSEQMDTPIRGEWRLDVDVMVDDFNKAIASTTIPIR